VPAEVAIEFGLTGPYVNYIGGATATLDAIWYAGRLLDRGECARALVLAVEALEECGDLYRRGRWLAPGPLVEAAACALFVPGGPRCVYADDIPEADTLGSRLGETFACGPLVALAARTGPPGVLTAAWRGRRSALRWI
jgi:hypothetical protein